MPSWFVALTLAVLACAAYAPVLENHFVTFDDDVYIIRNPHVLAGLTTDGLRWAFSTTYYGIYHPLAWVSHMLDIELFGLDPAAHHAHSVLIHAAAAALLFIVLRRMTGMLWPSALAAALFAVHPLSVQSVAWAAERKNVLSGLFWMLTIWCYLRWAEKPGHLRYFCLILVYTLGLLAKPFLVTAPLSLLILDVWPLHRAGESTQVPGFRFQVFWRRVREKIPLFLLGAAASVATVLAARYSANRDVLIPLQILPLDMRLATAAVGYVAYLGKLLWPFRLTFLYPYPEGGWPLWQSMGSVYLLGCITLLAVKAWPRRPYLLAGWAWYLVTLLPNIGLTQYGWQAYADRYAYIPLVGIYVAAAWGLADLVRAARGAPGHTLRSVSGWLAPVGSGVAILLLAARTQSQVRTWRDDLAFFGHGLKVSPDTWAGYYSHLYLGRHLYEHGDIPGAMTHYIASLRGYKIAETCNNIGAALHAQGRREAAMTWYSKAIRMKPSFIRAYFNLGLAYQELGDLDKAAACYAAAIRLGPTRTPMTEDAILKNEPVDDDANVNLGVIRLAQGRTEEAVECFRAALRFNPKHANAHYNLGLALESLGRRAEAAEHFRRALELDPRHEKARKHLELL